MDAAGVRSGVTVLLDEGGLLAVRKPAGLLSHPNPDGKGKAVFLGRYHPPTRRFRSDAGDLWLVHRLDRDTSGVLLGARDERTRARLQEAFEDGRVEKRYLALVGRPPRPAAGLLEDRLVTRRGGGRARTRVVEGPPDSRLEYRVKERLAPGGPTLLEVDLLTGRTHQIRVQLAARHLPVLGDDVYGDFRDNRRLRKEVGLRRLFLHASRLVVPGADGTPRRISCPLTEDLEAVLVRLRGGGGGGGGGGKRRGASRRSRRTPGARTPRGGGRGSGGRGRGPRRGPSR